MQIKSMDPITLKKRLEEGSAVLIDVREPHEHARERRRKARAAVALSGGEVRGLAGRDGSVPLP
jgi:rhodanese-related sulfurtransferase